MTQLSPDAITDAWLARNRDIVHGTALAPEAETTGIVEHVADGIAQVSGLPETRLSELLSFEGGRLGFALTLDAETISAVLLDEGDAIEAGSRVTRTREVVRVPVGPGLLGRVVDPLGRPLDGKGPVTAEAHLPVERPAPGIIERDLVSQPVDTGILIIGDRATGKTAIAIDTIINQKNSDLVCVYVAVGQRTTAVKRVIEAVRRYGAPERCIFVVASAAFSSGLQWIAPFAGFTMAEYFRDHGQHALIVIDDLSKHAVTHRELSLLSEEHTSELQSLAYL